MRKLVVALVAVLVAFTAAPVAAGPTGRLPSEIDLPDGYFPEGIAAGRGSTFYVGSLSEGTIWRGDFRTGEGAVLTEPAGQFTTVGLAVDADERVWVAGGPTGTARVYDGRSGALLATYELTGPFESFINDVIVTHDGAWFTDSGTQDSPDPSAFRFAGSPRLFKVPLGPAGQLPGQGAVEELPTTVPDVDFPNLNGIETTPDGNGLVVAHTTLGQLYTVDPATGAAQAIDVDTTFIGADGLVRNGQLLYVVENGAAQVSSVRLDRGGTVGALQRVLPAVGAETPTTAAIYRRGVYIVDARFGSMTGPYKVFRLPLSCRNVRAWGAGQVVPPLPGDPPDLVRTVADIRGGGLRGSTEAAFTTTDPTPPVIGFSGELTLTTNRGTLTLALDGTLDVVAGVFSATGPVIGSTGNFEGAIGTLTLEGPQDLADPTGAFTETIVGELCYDRGNG